MESRARTLEVSILNLNIQHGRNSKITIWPPAPDKATFLKNYRAVIDLIRAYNPDIVTLQEVDFPNLCNRFLSPETLFQEALGDYQFAFGIHALFPSRRLPLFASGTAVLSKYPVYQTSKYTFQRVLPIPRKGFVFTRALINRDGHADYKYLNILSVHCTDIDGTFRHPRLAQQEHISRAIRVQNEAGNIGRWIVAGDFNEEWRSETAVLQKLTEEGRLIAYEPEATQLATYPADRPQERLDWILASKDCQFTEYRILSEQVSDHRAILARAAVPIRPGDPQ
jgi:endonuclease/exonuclease/phosphatase family metal-dependent hydrolase